MPIPQFSSFLSTLRRRERTHYSLLGLDVHICTAESCGSAQERAQSMGRGLFELTSRAPPRSAKTSLLVARACLLSEYQLWLYRDEEALGRGPPVGLAAWVSTAHGGLTRHVRRKTRWEAPT